MRRAMLLAHILAPPLPMLCVGADGCEAITSSHDLLFAVIGRLLALPDGSVKMAFPDSGFHGDWQSHLLGGSHAMRLLGEAARYELFPHLMPCGPTTACVRVITEPGTCGGCGYWNSALGGSRIFKCNRCSVELDRDVEE